MRELNNKEVLAVSGAGAIADSAGKLGEAIGEVVSPDVAGAAGQLGKGIGNILEINPIDAVKNMGAGIRGIVSWFKSRHK